VLLKRVDILLLACFLTLSGCAKNAQKRMEEPTDEIGPRLKLGRVTFVGNTVFTQGQLLDKMTSKRGKRFDDYTFQQDLRKIIYSYQKKGYLEARFENREQKVDLSTQEMDWHLTIDEGQLSAIGRIKFEGNTLYSDSLLLSLLKVRTGDALNLASVKQTSTGIVTLYAEKGYLYASVKDTIVKTEDSHISDVYYKISEGNPVCIGRIEIKGNHRVSSKVIKREMNLSPGELVSPSKIYDNQQKVYSLGLFTEVRFEMQGLEEKRDTIDLVLMVKEDKNSWVGINFGYQPPFSVQGGVEWGSDNVFGNLQKLTIRTEGSYAFKKVDDIYPYTNDYYIDYLEPYFLSLPLKASSSVYYKRKRNESSFMKPLSLTGGEGKIGRSLTKYLQVFLGYRYEFVAQTGSNISAAFITATADGRNDLFNPTQGYNITGRVEQAGSVLGGTDDFRKTSGEISYYHNLGRNIILAWRTKASGIYTFNRVKPVPIQERLRLGGPMNLRGYTQDELFTDTLSTVNMLMNGNVELRVPVYWMFGACAFVDAGNVWSDFNSVQWKQYHGGTGLGLRFYTPIGPVRLDYAIKTEGKMELKGGLFYINLGHAF
jgi:outer membrane protein insertion porin family